MRAAGLPILLLGCSSGPPPADRAALQASLAFPGAGGPLGLWRGEPFQDGRVTVTPVRFDLVPGWQVSGALWTPDQPGDVGIVVAQGHFGQGKSGPEAQEMAWRLARRGVRVLAVDTPGMEEWDRPGRHVHFDEGGHNRGYLAAGGTSTLALQVTQLQRGLDVLQAEGAQHLGATGASGGAVQSFYLALADDRVESVVLASTPPLPKEARAGGCPCDQLPAWPGPDPHVVAALPVPSLWLADGLDGKAPEGLPRRARWVPTAGPHSYTPEMQDLALAHFADTLGIASRPQGPDGGPLTDLRAGTPPADAPSIFDLPLQPTTMWTATPPGGDGHHELSCSGSGPTVLLAGNHAADRDAVLAQGLRACEVRIPEDMGAVHEAIALRTAAVDHTAQALGAAARRCQAQGIYAVRAWGVPSLPTGLPYIVREPVRSPQQLQTDSDPLWIHVPGAWWGALEPVWAGAVATGTDPTALAKALKEAVSGPQ